MLFAATYPARTRALLLIGAEVKEEKTDDWPWGEGTKEEFDAWVAVLPERWGHALALDRFFPDDPDPEATRRWFARLQTSSMTPRDAIAFMSMAMEIDVRDVVPSVRVPTLIVHRVDDPICHVENGRFLAANIPDARYIELPGNRHIPWAGSGGDEIVEEIREFLTGVREAQDPDRVLATVLFTDIVGSTEKATALGDRAWRELVERHHTIVRAMLGRYRGVEQDVAGDGFFATFDGPARGVKCAQAIVDAIGPLEVEIRAGVHTGEVGTAGDKASGIAVNVAARIAALAQPSEILVSQTVKDLVAGSGLRFHDRGSRELRGVEGAWHLYAVVASRLRDRVLLHSD
jgi:class 3 adenylate cyclase